MSNLLIGVTIDPLVAGIMWTEHNDPFTDHVTYSFSPEQLEAMQQDYATGPLAQAIHDWLVREGREARPPKPEKEQRE